MNDYTELLIKDLADQFKGKAKIEGLMNVIGKQLNELYSFFSDLKTKRNIYTAEGKQLDGIGDIVALSRQDALKHDGSTSTELNDDSYRKMLIHKILQNTSTCTYYEIMEAIKMLWEGNPIHYKETPEKPATILYSFDASSNLTQESFEIPFIKACGVGIEFTMKNKSDFNIFCGIARRQLIKTTVFCNAPELFKLTFVTDDNETVVVDDNSVGIGVKNDY